MAACLGGEFYADTEDGFCRQLFGTFKNKRQFIGHFHYQNTGKTHFGGIEAQVDELFILVTIADKNSLLITHGSHGSNQFGLGARFQAMMVAGAILGNFFHHLLLLVHFNGIGTQKTTVIAQFIHGSTEGFV